MDRGKLVSACAVAAVVLSLVGAASHVVALAVPIRLSGTDFLVPHFFDGRTRLFWLRSLSGAIDVDSEGINSLIWVHAQVRRSAALAEQQAGPPSPPTFDFPIQIGSRQQVGPFGGRWRSPIGPRSRAPQPMSHEPWTVESTYVRFPIWPLVVLLTISPIRRSIVERRRRRRMGRNECVACGYSLFGLIEPRCPECGLGFLRTMP